MNNFEEKNMKDSSEIELQESNLEILEQICENVSKIGMPGHQHADEVKEKISESMKTARKDNSHNSKMTGMSGKKHTEEAKKKVGESAKGRFHSKESIERAAEKIRTPKEREDQIIKAYNSNMTIKEIVEKFAIGKGTIYRILKDRNIKK